MVDILTALLAVILGPVATFGFYMLLNWLVNLLPRKAGNVVRPYIFIGPVPVSYTHLTLPTTSRV